MCILLLEKPALGAWSWAEMKVVDLEEQLQDAHCAVETEREQREIAEKESATIQRNVADSFSAISRCSRSVSTAQWASRNGSSKCTTFRHGGSLLRGQSRSSVFQLIRSVIAGATSCKLLKQCFLQSSYVFAGCVN